MLITRVITKTACIVSLVAFFFDRCSFVNHICKSTIFVEVLFVPGRGTRVERIVQRRIWYAYRLSALSDRKSRRREWSTKERTTRKGLKRANTMLNTKDWFTMWIPFTRQGTHLCTHSVTFAANVGVNCVTWPSVRPAIFKITCTPAIWKKIFVIDELFYRIPSIVVTIKYDQWLWGNMGKTDMRNWQEIIRL